eukprot:352000-Chlamydomonas_euryale.AAC.4
MPSCALRTTLPCRLPHCHCRGRPEQGEAFMELRGATQQRDSAALLHQTQNTGVSKLVLVGIQVLVQAAQHFRRKQLGWRVQNLRQYLPLVRLDEEWVVH